MFTLQILAGNYPLSLEGRKITQSYNLFVYEENSFSPTEHHSMKT
jgi:hypothetical protein